MDENKQIGGYKLKSLINRYRSAGALFTVAILSACFIPITAYADPSNGTLGIIANYSDEIPAQHGDTFTIDYVNDDTGDDGFNPRSPRRERQVAKCYDII